MEWSSWSTNGLYPETSGWCAWHCVSTTHPDNTAASSLHPPLAGKGTKAAALRSLPKLTQLVSHYTPIRQSHSLFLKRMAFCDSFYLKRSFCDSLTEVLFPWASRSSG